MLKVGDKVFIRPANSTIYQILDTDPRFLSCGVVKKIDKETITVCDCANLGDTKVYHLNKVKEFNINQLLSFKDYIELAKALSYHLESNCDIVESF